MLHCLSLQHSDAEQVSGKCTSIDIYTHFRIYFSQSDVVSAAAAYAEKILKIEARYFKVDSMKVSK